MAQTSNIVKHWLRYRRFVNISDINFGSGGLTDIEKAILELIYKANRVNDIVCPLAR